MAATLAVNVLDYFEHTLAHAVMLSLFVPLLIGTGGNAGAQSATTVVRALAIGDVQPGEAPTVVAREVSTGAGLGISLAVVGLVGMALFAGARIAIVVCVLGGDLHPGDLRGVAHSDGRPKARRRPCDVSAAR